MSGIKIIRRHFGLSQQQLAAYLDVQRSLLAMAETNRRSLPAAALLKLALLQKTALAAKKTVSLPPEVQKKFSAQVNFEIKELQYRAALLQQKLDAMKKRYTQAVQKTMLAAVLKPQQKKNTKDAAWQQLAEAEAKTALQKNHAGMQAMLQVKITCLQQEEKALSKLLKSFCWPVKHL